MVWLESGWAGGHDRTGAGMTRGAHKITGTNSGHKKRAHDAPLDYPALIVGYLEPYIDIVLLQIIITEPSTKSISVYSFSQSCVTIPILVASANTSQISSENAFICCAIFIAAPLIARMARL